MREALFTVLQKPTVRRLKVAKKAVWLARGEVDLDAGLISFYALRRKGPLHQPLLKTVNYRFPKRKFIDRAGD